MKNINVKNWLVVMGLAFVGMLSSAPVIAQTNNNPGIAPIQSKPHGHSYSEWAATFWQWALAQAARANPVTDTSGQFCTAGQEEIRRVELRIREGGDDEDEASDDKAWVAVWFLAGTFGDPSPVNRTCTVPAGQALFFPVIDAFYGAFLNDPPGARTAAFIRSQVNCTIKSAKVKIDGILVDNPQQYFLGPQKSLLFDVQLPTDNVAMVTSKQVHELLLPVSRSSATRKAYPTFERFPNLHNLRFYARRDLRAYHSTECSCESRSDWSWKARSHIRCSRVNRTA